MKIEIGESLIRSWLQQVKKCQSVHLNWEPLIDTWELHNEDNIIKTLEITKNYFKKKRNYSIYKNTNSYLDISQLETIDVLGLKIISNNHTNIYGVTINFQEDGLNYGSTTASIEKIIEKMVSTALLIHGYFNMSEGQIIFASPKIDNTLFLELTASIKILNSLFTKLGFMFKFHLYANDAFNNKIVKPIAKLSNSTLDHLTSTPESKPNEPN